MARMSTLHEIAMARATKQPGIVDSITEDAPILDHFKWIPATHGLWNVAEKLTDIVGPGWAEPDSPLPVMSTSSDLVTTELNLMGGTLEVPSARAAKFGGALKYFADRQDRFLKDAGRKVEIQICQEVFFKAAHKVGNLRDAGGENGGFYILAVRFDDLCNVGLYDPDQFDQGRFLRIDMPYNGAEHYLTGKGYEGVLGFSVVYRGHFGWQLLDPDRTVAAIVNIDETHYPGISDIDDMLADIRADNGNTWLFMGPRAKIYGINPHKKDYVQLTNSETEMKTLIETWNGIRIVTSHNINDVKKRITTGIKKKIGA